MTFRATVLAGTYALGNPCSVAVDGSTVALTANGLGGYQAAAGDRVLCSLVDNQLEIIQFISRAVPPGTPISTGIVAAGAYTMGSAATVTLSGGAGTVTATGLPSYLPRVGDAVTVALILGTYDLIQVPTTVDYPGMVMGGPYTMGATSTVLLDAGPSVSATGQPTYLPVPGDRVVVTSSNGAYYISHQPHQPVLSATVTGGPYTLGASCNVTLASGGTATAVGLATYFPVAGDVVKVALVSGGTYELVQTPTASYLSTSPGGANRIDIESGASFDTITFYHAGSAQAVMYTDALGSLGIYNGAGLSGFMCLSIGPPVPGNFLTLQDPSGGPNSLQINNTGISWTGNLESDFFHTSANANGFRSAAINNTNITSGTNNVVIHTSNGIVGWATSSAKYKMNVQDLDTSELPSLIDNLRPVTYEDKHHYEQKAAGNEDWQHDIETNIGFIAEEVEALGWVHLVSHHAETGEVMSIQYDRIITPLVLELRDRFAKLENRLSAIEAKLNI